MITISQIANGSTYLSKHLSANDYYSEGEKVKGEWWGKGADRLDLKGQIGETEFEALRTNRNPSTGDKLTARDGKKNAFHDITISAPKSVSILAVVGQDDRVREAFKKAVSSTCEALERHAAVRERQGIKASSNGSRPTGNVVAAVFHHDTSRLLDPQLHAHVVLANATYDQQREAWFALQPKPMMESSVNLTRQFRQDLAAGLQHLGYSIEWSDGTFRVAGISHEIEQRYSQRTIQRLAFEDRYREIFGQAPSKSRVEAFIKEGKTAASGRFREEYHAAFQMEPPRKTVERFVQDWRDPKLKSISSASVRAIQKSRLSSGQLSGLRDLVTHAQRSHDIPNEGSAQNHLPPHAPIISRAEEDHSQNPITSKSKLRRLRPAGSKLRIAPYFASRARGEAIGRLRRALAIQAAFRGAPQGLLSMTVKRTLHSRHHPHRSRHLTM